jgi:RNA polymerase sigma-70 factor (ECF subfamily)
MAAFADGDNFAFDALYRRNYDWVQRLAYQILRNQQDAEDIAQEAFLRVIASRNHWQATARFRSWMHRIVVNLCLKWQKNFRRQEAISLESWLENLDELPLELLSTEEDSARETAEVLQDALSHLPERQRQAVELRLQGYSISQIARLLGCSRGAVDALLHRARKSLRKRLGKV